MASRLEIRLDDERHRKLEELAQSRQVSISDLFRSILDREYEEWLGARRVHAARTIASLSAEDVPAPAALGQQLDSTYEPPLH